VAYATRQYTTFQAKEQIALKNCPLKSLIMLPLFINIGTTTETVAREFIYHQGYKLFTNNLNVAAILSGKRRHYRHHCWWQRVRSRDGALWRGHPSTSSINVEWTGGIM